MTGALDVLDDATRTALPRVPGYGWHPPMLIADRKRVLHKAFDFHDPLRLSAHSDTDGEAFYDEACWRGWEGLIAKRADARITAVARPTG
jgi:hypothetical protein